MAVGDYYDDPTLTQEDIWRERTPTAPPSASAPYQGSGGQSIDVRAGVDPASIEAQLKAMGGSLYDKTDLEGVLRHTGYNTGGQSLEQALAEQQKIYQTRQAGDGGGRSSASSSGSMGSSGGDSGTAAFLDYLKGKDAQENQWRGSIRDILMGQLGSLSQPVTPDSPGISGVLQGERIASQRAAEKARAQAAEEYASQGLGQSGALNTAFDGILQQQGEKDAQFQGQTLQGELNNRRAMLQSLLATALQSGDSQSALALQLQMQALNSQAQQSQFGDQMAYNYNSLNANQNGNMLAALLGALA